MTDGKSYSLAVDSPALYGTSEAAFEGTESLHTTQSLLKLTDSKQRISPPRFNRHTQSPHGSVTSSKDAGQRRVYTSLPLQVFPGDTDQSQVTGMDIQQAQKWLRALARMMKVQSDLGQMRTGNTAELASSGHHGTGLLKDPNTPPPHSNT